MVEKISAKEVMQPGVITVAEGDSLSAIAKIFTDKGISGAPVLDAEGLLVGVISISDLVRVALKQQGIDYPKGGFYRDMPEWAAIMPSDGGFEDSFETTLAHEVMSREVFTASPEDSVAGLAGLMRQHRIHRLIVVRDRQVEGIISSMDLLRLLENH